MEIPGRKLRHPCSISHDVTSSFHSSCTWNPTTNRNNNNKCSSICQAGCKVSSCDFLTQSRSSVLLRLWTANFNPNCFKSYGFLTFPILFTILILAFCNVSSQEEIAFEVPTSCAEQGVSVAGEYNCTYMGQVGSLARHCIMDCSYDVTKPVRRRKRSKNVVWMERQVPHVRQKRDFSFESRFDDTHWQDMWYLNRNQLQHNLPDHNVTAAWDMGYTGKGVVVTFLDDGLEYDHPDLRDNYDPEASYDINANDSDPSPRYDLNNQNKHGTRCAGEVAAAANNNFCIIGAAFNARIGGIRMLDGEVTDRVEAFSLSHRPDHIDIYSASWGPDDNGKIVDGPGKMTKKAFENGTLYGRNGKGSIFVWASGNGGREGDSCACDGYINSIYTFAISATTEVGDKPWYQEECAGTLASTFSSGDSNRSDRGIVTTDIHHTCTSHHTGTSASAPLAAAFIALVLEARPDLTWRDVMYICVLGARPDAIRRNDDYVINAVGFKVSNRYGFGLMDAGYMVYLATRWYLVPPMMTCESSRDNEPRHLNGLERLSTKIFFDACRYDSNQVSYVEQVQIVVSISCKMRGSLQLYAKSPRGTRSQILPTRRVDDQEAEFKQWPFLSVQFWGEDPYGEWELEVINTKSYASQLKSWHIIVHGTREDAKRRPYRLRVRSPSSVSSSRDAGTRMSPGLLACFFRVLLMLLVANCLRSLQ